MRGFLRALLWIAGLVGVTALILRATCVRLWTIPGDDPLFSASIMPTLEPGDLVVLLRRGTPTFGDLVRCADPEAPGRDVIGRIVGEPGDHVVMDGTVIQVNNKPAIPQVACVPSKVVVTDPTTGNPAELWCDIEELGGTSYMRIRSTGADARSKVTATDVKAPNVFIASDDRHFHDDSRDFGPIPLSTCPERIIFRIWSAEGWFDEKKRLTYVR